MITEVSIFYFIKNSIEEMIEAQPTKSITLQSHLINDLGLDSLDVMQLMVLVEDQFCIRLKKDEYPVINHLDTVECLVKFTESLIEKSEKNATRN